MSCGGLEMEPATFEAGEPAAATIRLDQLGATRCVILRLSSAESRSTFQLEISIGVQLVRNPVGRTSAPICAASDFRDLLVLRAWRAPEARRGADRRERALLHGCPPKRWPRDAQTGRFRQAAR